MKKNNEARAAKLISKANRSIYSRREILTGASLLSQDFSIGVRAIGEDPVPIQRSPDEVFFEIRIPKVISKEMRNYLQFTLATLGNRP
jgi:hypothetical protein